MARFFNFSNSEEFVLELRPEDLLSSEERAFSTGFLRKWAYPPADPTRDEAQKRNGLKVIGRFERSGEKGAILFLN